MSDRDRRLRAMGARDERERLAGLLAAQKASQEIANLVDVLGLSAELDAAWDDLHPEDKAKPRGWLDT